jgi:hypothetical protein
MPTVDRRPRRRIHTARTPDFRSEREAREAAAAVRSLPDGPDREAALRELRPRLERWVNASWAVPKQNDSEWHDGVLRAYISGRFLPPLRPEGARP